MRWDAVPLESICERITSGGTPSRKRADRQYYDDSGHLWVKTKELADGWIDDTEERITDAALRDSSAKLLPPGTVLLAMYGATVGKLGILRTTAACNQACAALVSDPAKTDARFLFYALLAQRAKLQSRAVGSAQQNLSGALVKRFEVPCPPVAEQRAIASVLGALDDKIEGNLRLERVLASTVELSHLRAVSAPGVDTRTLADLGVIVGGGTPKSAVAEYWDPPTVPWLTPKDMTALDGAPVVWDGQRGISELGLAKSSAKLLPAGSVVYTSRATLGLIAVTQQPVATNQGFISVIPDPKFSSAFVYATLRHRSAAIADRAQGSTFQEVNKSNFKAVEFPCPSARARAEFDGVAEPTFGHLASLVAESRTLTALRDALLPKLVSGKIRVPISDDPEESLGSALEQHEADVQTAPDHKVSAA